MSVPPLLRKIFLVDLLKGLRVTFSYQDAEGIYTEQYPLERPQVAERYRGQPRLNMNPEKGETLCIACNLCALACPENLIVVKGERDPVTKRKVADHVHLRPEPLHVLRPVRRRLLDGCAGADAGFRDGAVQPRRHGAGPAERWKKAASPVKYEQ